MTRTSPGNAPGEHGRCSRELGPLPSVVFTGWSRDGRSPRVLPEPVVLVAHVPGHAGGVCVLVLLVLMSRWPVLERGIDAGFLAHRRRTRRPPHPQPCSGPRSSRYSPGPAHQAEPRLRTDAGVLGHRHVRRSVAADAGRRSRPPASTLAGDPTLWQRRAATRADRCRRHHTTRNCPIIPLSSWFRRWQWYMYGVLGSAKSVNRMIRLTVSPGRTTTVSL